MRQRAIVFEHNSSHGASEPRARAIVPKSKAVYQFESRPSPDCRMFLQALLADHVEPVLRRR